MGAKTNQPGDQTRFFFEELQKQLAIEASVIESHLDALEGEFAKIANPDAAAAGLMQEAIRMKRRQLESIQRQLNRISQA